MTRRDFIKSAALASTAMATSFGGLSYHSRPAAAAGSSRLGAWSSGLNYPELNWTLIPIHAVLLGDGRVLSYGTSADGVLQQTGHINYDIWTPPGWDRRSEQGIHEVLSHTTQTDLFCNTQVVLPQSGKVFLAGGDVWDPNKIDLDTGRTGATTNTGNYNPNIFDPSTKNITRSVDGGGNLINMKRKRWYASSITLRDGRTYIQGGSDLNDGGLNYPNGNDRPEIRNLDGSFQLLDGVDTSGLFPWYPRNWVAPNGLVFGYADRSMYYVDPSGNGSITMLGAMPADGPSGWTSTEVMFAPGRILRTGGGSTSAPEGGSSPVAPKNAAAVIDLTGSTPTYKKQPSMPVALHWANSTVMADGNVVVTGGGSVYENDYGNRNTYALIWRADTGSWTQGAQAVANRSRLYHSVALLMPDATVLSAGGGAPGPERNANAEIYYPPYLFTNAGAFAPRPTIAAAPSRVSYNTPFDVSVSASGGVQRVTFIKTSSVTHSFNSEQRFMQLSFTAAGNTLKVQSPTMQLATPGYYMLFVIDKQGVPSVARIIGIG